MPPATTDRGPPGCNAPRSLAPADSPPAARPLPRCLCCRLLQGDPITLKVNKLMSVKNLPYQYYSLPYCRPDKIISSAENLGEVLRGDRIENSPYQVRVIAPDRECSLVDAAQQWVLIAGRQCMLRQWVGVGWRSTHSSAAHKHCRACTGRPSFT